MYRAETEVWTDCAPRHIVGAPEIMISIDVDIRCDLGDNSHEAEAYNLGTV